MPASCVGVRELGTPGFQASLPPAAGPCCCCAAHQTVVIKHAHEVEELGDEFVQRVRLSKGVGVGAGAARPQPQRACGEGAAGAARRLEGRPGCPAGQGQRSCWIRLAARPARALPCPCTCTGCHALMARVTPTSRLYSWPTSAGGRGRTSLEVQLGSRAEQEGWGQRQGAWAAAAGHSLCTRTGDQQRGVIGRRFHISLEVGQVGPVGFNSLRGRRAREHVSVDVAGQPCPSADALACAAGPLWQQLQAAGYLPNPPAGHSPG